MDIADALSAYSMCQDSTEFNRSFPCPHNPNTNSTLPSFLSPPSFAMSYFTMTFGALSNLTALAILSMSYTRFHRQAKTPFLLLAVILLLIDLAGHLITGAFALHLHLGSISRHRVAARAFEPHQAFCKLFGACMVFFGLSPLLLGSAMAVERCMGITHPIQHSIFATTANMRLIILLLFVVVITLAVLPILDVGSYKPQFPGTWCFLPVHGALSAADASLAFVFSSLGLIALMVSVLCNTISGLTLLHARFSGQGLKSSISRRYASSSSSSLHSLDIEMMLQLAVITVVSCVCWSPFLIYVSISVRHYYRDNIRPAEHYEHLLLLALRMASWNQILDPWVYILLRRAVLCRVCVFFHPKRVHFSHSSSCTASKGQDIRLQ